MSCQKEITKRILEGGADYVIGLKGNQPALLENVSPILIIFPANCPAL